MQQSPTLDVLATARSANEHVSLSSFFKKKNLPRQQRVSFSFFFRHPRFLSVIITCIPDSNTAYATGHEASTNRERKTTPAVDSYAYIVEIIAGELCGRAVERRKSVLRICRRNRFFRQRTLRTSFELFIMIRCCSKRVFVDRFKKDLKNSNHC